MINRVIIVGRLTKAPELRTTPNGISVMSFTLAFDNKSKGPNGEKTSSFINCTAWRQNAEFISKYCQKGTQIGIEGSLQERKYVRKDGSNASTIDIIVDSVTLFGSKNQNTTGGYQQPTMQANTFEAEEPQIDDIFKDSSDGDLADDDLPF